jgi:GNAT superfamily N-acetyltransferase
MTLTIRTMTEADLDIANDVVAAAYRPPASRRRELARYLALQPDGWLLAAHDGEPAGVVGATDYGPFAYVGMMSVHPRFQRRGIGLALMERLLAWLDGRGCPIALLDATEAGAPLYERCGFQDDAKTLPFLQDDCALRPRESERVRPLRPPDLAVLAEFDAPVFGARRLAVFESLLADLPDRAFIAHDAAGQIAGYLFAQRRLLGPWVARTAEDAEALLAAALPLQYDSTPTVIVPGTNAAAPGLLMSHGFSPQRVLRHMRRGGSAAPGRRALLFGQASFAIG